MSWQKYTSSGNSIKAENSYATENSNASEISCSRDLSDASGNSSTGMNSNTTENAIPRRGGRKPRSRIYLTYRVQGEPGSSWEPLDQEIDTTRESALMLKISSCMEKFAESKLCISFLDQMQTPGFQGEYMKVLGSERTMRMVIYGIGSIESSERSRMQMSLALLMKRKFEWIGDIEVFDPVLSLTELKVIEDLGCSVLSVNEIGRRKVVESTLFFMPQCDVELYENLLDENWSVDLLNRFIVLGNSLRGYVEFWNFLVRNNFFKGGWFRGRRRRMWRRNFLVRINFFRGRSFRGRRRRRFTKEEKEEEAIRAATSLNEEEGEWIIRAATRFSEVFETENNLCDDLPNIGELHWHFFAPTQEQLLSTELILPKKRDLST